MENETIERIEPDDNIYVCPKCGPLDDFIVIGTISISAEEKVNDYLDDVIFICPECREEVDTTLL